MLSLSRPPAVAAPLLPVRLATLATAPCGSADVMTVALALVNASQHDGNALLTLWRCQDRCLLALHDQQRLEWRVPTDYLLLLVVHRGDHHLQVGGSCRQLGPTAVELLGPGQELRLHTVATGLLSLVLLPLQTLQTAALELGVLLRWPQQPLPLVHAPALAHLLEDMSVSSPGWLAERIHYHRLCLCDGLLLQQWPDLVQPMTSLVAVADACCLRLRQLLLDKLQEEPDLDHLAAQCGVSTRTLYNRVRHQFGCTPGELIRQLRIEAVYHQLCNGAGSVTDLAIAYGFTNLGRFARQYRQHVGELPSTTLARCKGRG
jgi:AraC-like DNA-binding protein